jgi:hypothetical protein
MSVEVTLESKKEIISICIGENGLRNIFFKKIMAKYEK